MSIPKNTIYIWLNSNLFFGILFRNVDDNQKSYSSSNHHSIIVPEEFENDCSEILFCASGDNSEASSTHYLKVEPIIDADATKFRYWNHKNNLIFIYSYYFAISDSPVKEDTKKDDQKTEEIFECDLCSKRFNIKKSLAMHFAMVHRPRKVFNCKYCPKTYWNLKILEKHMMAHGKTHGILKFDRSILTGFFLSLFPPIDWYPV